MLSFLRRHQKIFFVVITTIIVISFSFFGTFGSFVNEPAHDLVAFTAIDGSKVYQSQVRDLVALISTDAQEAAILGQPYAVNGLNDGVIKQDIFDNGLGFIIAKPFINQLIPSYSQRLDREKRYAPYRHPQAPFISAEIIWNYFAPNIKKNFDALIVSQDPLSQASFDSRINLYLAEQEFPSSFLKQIIRYQETQHQSIVRDDRLVARDLSLFGYHNVLDWFGKEYIELIAKYIINVAKYAEQEGLQISTDEALGSLYNNAVLLLKDEKLQQLDEVLNPNEYLQTTVHRLGMDQGRAAYVWRWVLLFRRYINEQKDNVLLSTLAFRDYYRVKNEFVDVELYALPKELRLHALEDLEKFDLYTKAVAIKEKSHEHEDLFKEKLPVEEVKKLYPDLVQRNFLLRVASCNKNELEGKIGLKKTWQWQVEDSNWAKIQEKFPELGKIKTTDQNIRFEARHEALDDLDANTRTKVDAFSRTQIVDGHPEWISQALEKADIKEEDLRIREHGGYFPFPGIIDRRAFFALLEQAPLNEAYQELQSYTQDHIHYYKICVVERGEEELLSYKEALDDKTLDHMLTSVLESTYQSIRSKNPAPYLTENGEFKPLALVRAEIAEKYFEADFSLLDREVENIKKEYPHLVSWDNSGQARAAGRLMPFMRKTYMAVKANPDAFHEYRLERVKKRLFRNSEREAHFNEAAALEKNSWSRLAFSPENGMFFYQVLDKGVVDNQEEIRDKILDAKKGLAQKLVFELGEQLLQLMLKNNALSIGPAVDATVEPAAL